MSTTTTTMTTTTTTTAHPNVDPLNPTLWTTAQELCLLQSLTRFKPVGIHKHFRMLAIQSSLLTSGTIPQPNNEHPHVSTTGGIWRKLESLYDLKALDEREDAIFADTADAEADDNDDNDDNDNDNDNDRDNDGSDERAEYWREFELPADGFAAEMWGRRLATGAGAGEDDAWSAADDGASVRQRDRESTVADSEDLRSSPVDAAGGSARGTRFSGRRAAAAAAAGRRLAEVKMEETGTGSVRGGGSRRTSKAASLGGDEDTEMADVGDGQEENEDGSDEEDAADTASSDQEETTTEDDRKSARPTRGRGGRRARGRRGRRGK